MKTFLKTLLLTVSSLFVGLVTDGVFNTNIIVTDAEARLGRPLTPVSVAGAARRTTRRVVRRSAVYVNTLPRGCATVIVEGMTLQQCGGSYYQVEGNQYVIVNVN